MPERTSSVNVARQLCIDKADEIGGLTNENVVSACLEPVALYLQKVVKDWIDSKTLVVPISFDGKVSFILIYYFIVFYFNL